MATEYVVRRIGDKGNVASVAVLGHDTDRGAVHDRGPRFIFLGLVDCGVGGAVDQQAGTHLVENRRQRLRVAKVHIEASEEGGVWNLVPKGRS